MLVFNTTYHVPSGDVERWITFIKTVHIPFMMSNAEFSKPQVARINGSENELGVSFSVQFNIIDMPTLINWHGKYSKDFQNQFQKEFGTELQFFSTVLEIID